MNANKMEWYFVKYGNKIFQYKNERLMWTVG